MPWTPAKRGDAAPNPSPLSTHQLLAFVLALWKSTMRRAETPTTKYDAFFASLPTSFPTVPLTWDVDKRTDLLDALPPSAAHRQTQLQRRCYADWARVEALDDATVASIWSCIHTSSFVRPTFDEFVWGWLCTNSRCVYMDLNYVRHEDNFTLAPLLDMANHTARTELECKVRYSRSDGLELCAPRQPLSPGDEVCITYGPHGNAMLLVEYGFVLPMTLHPETPWPGNPHSDVSVDDMVLTLLDEQGAIGAWKRALLQSEGYWGDYTLHPMPAPAHPSHRLRTALRLVCMDVQDTRPPPLASDDQSVKKRRTPRIYTRDDAQRAWRLVTHGGRDAISDENERAVRRHVLTLCTKVEQEHQKRWASLEGQEGEAVEMLRSLLREERQIARLVYASAEREDAW